MAGIYIHVPFCKKRCIYCDFYTRTNILPKQDYVSAICKEIALRKDYIEGERVKTIYFGGGTPSLMTYDDFTAIFSTIKDNFDVAEDAEITLEANPDDLNPKYIQNLLRLSFNRISIGIQSFNDRELAFLNRRHSAKKAADSVKLSKDLGFKNISIDLMYGLPGQTLDIWEQNLNEAISLDIQHISSYHLIYEQGTKLYKMLNQKAISIVDEESSVDMFSLMIDMLSAADFEHYEISNFARNGLYSKHNSSYWLGEKYLGLGPAAHSYDGQDRAWNIASISKYIEGIELSKPNIETEYLDLHACYNDFILTGLRTMWGLNLSKLETIFGAELKKYALQNIQKYTDLGYVSNEENVLKLNRKGIFISDSIMSDLMWIE